MTPISDYIVSMGGWPAAHAALAARPRFRYLIQQYPTPAALQAFLEGGPLQYVEQVEALADYRNRNYPPTPFGLVYPDRILFNSNVGANAGKVPPDRPIDIDWLFASLVSASTRINYATQLHKEHNDLEYGLLPNADIDWIAANRPSLSRDFPGDDPLRDCENAVAFDRGWLVAQGLVNAAVGDVQAVVKTSGREFAHAFMALIDTNRKIWFLDNASKDAVVKDPDAVIQFGVIVSSIDIFNVRF